MEDTNTIIQNAFNNLHPVVQRVLTSSDLAQKLRALAQTHALHLDKWTQLENEITMTLLGITAPEDLVGNITSHVGIPETNARSVVADATATIFDPLHLELEAELKSARSDTTHIPAEQKLALKDSGLEVPARVPQAAPQTVAGIVAARRDAAQKERETPTTPKKDALPGNTAADSSHMRRAISGDSYREQI